MNTNTIYKNIKSILENARNNAYRAVNFTMVRAYWQIGKVIVEEEQRGRRRAEYGKALISKLSQRLSKDFGKGFDESNLRNIRQFYLIFKKQDALRHELTWTHYRLLLRIENKAARNFYMMESIGNSWSTRELERQINSLLYKRIALIKDKKEVLKLSKRGQTILTPKDIIKDPYVLEFLDLEHTDYQEKELEQALINKLQKFLLELGKGFSFVSRQERITVDGDHFYVDLVFYNFILRCFVLIDLKMGKLTHKDIGQMDFYVRYFNKEKKRTEDNPAIGIILCSNKNETMVKYTMLDDKKGVFASKYKLYLPSEEELKKELIEEKEKIKLRKT